MVRSLVAFLAILANVSMAYTVYLTFPYEAGVAYRVTNNLSHIGVFAPDGHALVDYWVPLECDASVVKAFKRPPHLVVEVPCSDDPVYYTVGRYPAAQEGAVVV